MQKPDTKRSIVAVVVGVLFIIVVTTLVDVALHATGVYPPVGTPMDDRLSALATAYRIVISVAGAYLTARLAPQRPMKHALVLGVVGTVLGAAGAVATWDKGLGPAWYPVALAVLALPQCWAGGKLYELRHARAAARMA
jgi:hypothetical protein